VAGYAKSVLTSTCPSHLAGGSRGRRNGALSALACLTGHAGHTWASTGNGTPKPHANPNNETAGWRARSTVLETLGGLRVVAVRVSGDAGLRIKRQTYIAWVGANTGERWKFS
jgi:hypothetical protein